MTKNMIFDGNPILFTPNEDGTWKINKTVFVKDKNGESHEAEFCMPRCNIDFNSL